MEDSPLRSRFQRAVLQLDRWGHNRILVGALAAAVALAIYAQGALGLFSQERARDSYSYYYAAMALRDGVDPYDPQALKDQAPDELGHVFPYFYPPIFAQAWSPFLRLSPTDALGAWVAITSALALVNAALLWRLLPAPPYAGAWLLAFLGLHAVCGPLVSSVRLGQINVFLGTLVFAALLQERARRAAPAGALLAAAVLTKVTPVLYAFDLLSRRRLATLLSFVGVTGLMVGLSISASGVAPWRRFVEISLQPKPFNPVMSLHGLLTEVGSRAGFSPWLIQGLWGAGALALLAVVIVWLSRQTPQTVDPVRNWSVLTLFGLLASPLTWHHHYYLALLPFSYLVLREQPARLRAVAVLLALLALLRYPGAFHFLKPLCALVALGLLLRDPRARPRTAGKTG